MSAQALLPGQGRQRLDSVASTEGRPRIDTWQSVTSGRPSVASSRPSVASARPSTPVKKLNNARVSLVSAEVYANLPESSVSQEVVDHIMSVPPGEEVDIATCLGPTVPSIRLVSVLEVISLICFFPITYLSTAYELYWMLKYILVAPVVSYRLYVEWEALKYLIPPYVYDGVRATPNLWQVFGLDASFEVWRIVYSFFAVLSTVDTFLDTGFAADTMFVFVTDGGETQSAFEEMWHNGLLRSIPCFHISWLVFFMWLCLLVQPVANLIFTIPKGPVTYEIGNNGLQFYLFQRLNFEGVFFILSAGTGMSLIQSLEFRQGLHELYRIRPEQMISYVQPMGLAMFKRICYSWFLRNCIQLNVQTLIFGIHLHSGSEFTQTQTAVSIAVSIMMTLQKLTDIVTFERYVQIATEIWATDEELDAYIEKSPQNHLFRGWKDGFWKMLLAIRIFVGLTVGSLVLASVRLIMSLFVCETHLWDLFGGCVA